MNKLANSDYMENIFIDYIPAMTSATTPKGQIIYGSKVNTNRIINAMDKIQGANGDGAVYTNMGGAGTYNQNQDDLITKHHYGYIFESAVNLTFLKFRCLSGAANGSNYPNEKYWYLYQVTYDGSSWETVYEDSDYLPYMTGDNEINWNMIHIVFIPKENRNNIKGIRIAPKPTPASGWDLLSLYEMYAYGRYFN